MKEAIVRYVKGMGKIVTAICVVLAIFSMVSLVFAFGGFIGFMILAPVGIIAFLTVYSVYALKVSLDTVMGIEVTKEVVHVKVKRKIFTYDAVTGCIAVKEYKNKFVCTFQTQDSVDKFTFYKRPPFSKPYAEGFTEGEIRSFCPRFDELIEDKTA